jgi:hypothetical protein
MRARGRDAVTPRYNIRVNWTELARDGRGLKEDSFVRENLRAWSETLLGNIGPAANYDIAPGDELRRRTQGVPPTGGK